ncbi:uncharacterized protein LOC108905612 [Anoplophora glabripennis]|uniref:uncharacterized protein LOC108905612 n=1 Tax=Anoplophora glabripennis TaxID=217634 RepID=UPI0008753DD9|nr:uncharacterized protein LOC108905612 [Anoplophora glabripennis]
MKKKPELLKKTGKSSQTLRKFLNNLKENDLHYENKQITQCVFLGVLRLKPVPSIFSNNVPSVSTTVEINKSKRIKNIKSNKELNKNASKKNNINKVLSGKISKKSPDKVKADVKKVPIKKSSIKIKLNPKKKIHEVEPSMSNGNQETPSSDTSNTESPDSIIARSTLTISPIVSPTKFNPVQNLFDKLKQRREESQNEAGPSKIAALSNKTKEVSKSPTIRYKVCKINANGHSSPNINSCKKLKKSLYKKSHERLSLPLISTSPITVSDTESIDKKDKDDVILLDENNSSNGDSSDNGIVEDIIIINDDPRPKNEEVINQEIIDKRIQIRNSTSTLLNINAEQLVGTTQCKEVIVIADEPKQIDKLENNNITPLQKSKENHHITNKSDVIVIDEVREVRVSPRLKKIEEKAKETTGNIEQAFVDEVVIITDDKNVSNAEPEILQKDSVDISKTQELNSAVDSRQNENKKQKTSPKLSKIVAANDKLPAAIKKELIEEAVVVNEKPKRRKNTMRSPTLLPPLLLNAPMLLRSELAPKKPNYVNEKPRVRKSRSKIKDSSNSKPVMGPVKNTSKVESIKLNKNAKTLQLEKETSRSDQGYLSLSKVPLTMSVSCECEKQSDEIICIDDSSKNKSSNGRAMLKKLNVHEHNANNIEVERVQVSSHPQELGQKESPKSSCSKLQEHESVKDDIIILNDEECELKTKPKEIKKQRIKIFNKKSVSEVTAHKDEDDVIVKEENNPKEKISPRLLRSDLLKQKTLLEATNIHSPNTEKVESEVNEFINLTEEPESNKYISPRTLRSNFIKKDTSRNSLMDNIIVIKDEEFSTKSDEMLQKLSEADKSQQKNKRKSIQKTKQVDLDEIIIVNDRTVKKQEKYSGRLLRSDLSQLNAKKSIPIKTELEEVVLIHDEPKQKEKSAFLSLKPRSNELSCGSENVLVPEEQKSEIKGKTLRSSRLDRVQKYNTEVTSPKPKTKNSRIVKVENNSLPNSSVDQQFNVDNLHENSPRNFEQPLMEVIVVKVKKETSSHRLLRSETARRGLSENINVSNANIDNMISAPRLLRSELCTQRNSQNVTKEQCLSPKTTRKRRSPQNSPQSNESNTSSQNEPSKVVVIQNELIENQPFAPEDAEMQKQSELPVPENSPKLLGKKPEMASDIQDTEMQKQSDSSISKKSPKRLSKQSKILARSKKVVVSKKKKIFHNRKLVPKTPMLLRSELAHLKNVVSDIQSNEKKITKKKTKSKLDNVPNNNQLLDNSNSSFELQSNEKNEKKLKTRLSQTRSSNKNISKPEKHVEMIDSKKSAKIDANREENICEILETQTICQNEIVPTEVPMLLQQEYSSNSPTRKNKSNKILNIDTVQSSTEVDVVTTESPKRKSPSTRKKNKRKRITKPEQEQITSKEILDSQPVQFQDVQEENEICDISKKADITVFDFDESEPEVVPLRSNNTPKKEKSISFTSKDSTRSNPPEENVTPKSKKEKPTVQQGATPSEVNVTPKSKKQRIADEPIAKAQAKVQLLAVFDENPTQTKDLDTPANPDKNKTKSTSKKKVVKNQLVQEPCPQNVNVKRRSKPKTSPNKTNTPQTKQSQDTSGNTVRTSTSPLKQTTITDMFNVMMKKEKSSADSIFEPSPKEPTAKPREENSNVKTNMPPPKLDKKPPSNNDVEEYYEDDSDCDSRMEWIPEEYAEYKFKYSAKKMMTYKPIHKCKICLLILPTYYKLSKHKEEHAKKQNPYNCKQCERSFSNVEDLTAHLRVHKGKHPYTCKKCDVGFWSKKALDAHTPIHVLRKVKQPNKRFRCDVCAKEFSKLCDMERHTRVHTGEKPCICNICNKRFQQSHNLSKHLLTHLHVKPFHCEICNKQFGRNDVLNRHLLTHSVDKPIKCPLCSKGFIRQSQLNNHMKKNHLDAAKIGVTAEFKVAEAK